MKHKHTATNLFPTWYKSIDPAVDSTVAASRIAGITKLLEKEDTVFWLDIVLITLGIAPQNDETVSDLESTFNAEDVNFPLVSNENIIKKLSQILLCFLFENDNHTSVAIIALAVKNAVFFEQYDKCDVPFLEYASEILNNPTKTLDFDNEANISAVEDAIEAMEESPEDETTMDYTDQVALVKTVQYLYAQVQTLRQESDIMWWLFGQYSETNEAYFSELGLQKMVLTAAVDLSDLNETDISLPSARHLIHKALLIANDNKALIEKLSVGKVIEESSDKVKNKALANGSKVSALTPCLLAMSLSTQFDEASIWKSAFKSKLPGANIDSQYSAVNIAFQAYNEIKFLTLL